MHKSKETNALIPDTVDDVYILASSLARFTHEQWDAILDIKGAVAPSTSNIRNTERGGKDNRSGVVSGHHET